MITAEYIVLFVFISTYLCFVLFPSKRTLLAVFSSVILTIFCFLKFNKNLLYKIDLNVLNIFIGTLLVSDTIVESGIAEYLAEEIIKKTKSVKWTILLLCIVTGFLSAFLENVATLIIVAPVAFKVAEKFKINPAKFIFALAVSSNLQGTATLIGDPPSMLLAAASGMNFLDFFFYKGKPSIFFAVELGAVASFLVLYFIFSKEKNNVQEIEFKAEVRSWGPFYLLCLKILVLIFASIILPHGENSQFLRIAGFICLIAGVLSLLIKKFVLKTGLIKGIKQLDWETYFFLAGIFVLVGSLEISGWIEKFGKLLVNVVGTDKFIIYTIFVFSAVIISGFVDNVPFFLTMIPIAKVVSQYTGTSLTLLLFGLLVGTTLGGNITPTGAQANIVAWGMLKKQGYKTTFVDFLKLGFPFTVAAVLPTYIFIWFLWR